MNWLENLLRWLSSAIQRGALLDSLVEHPLDPWVLDTVSMGYKIRF